MTLTIGTGPFGDQGDKMFNFEVQAPRDHVLFFEDSPHRVRVMFGGETVADRRRVKLMHEQGHLPVYYFPRGDVRMDLLEATNHTTHCPFKGDASYWSVRVGDRVRAFSLHIFSVLFSYVLILLLPVLLWPRACLVRDRLTPLG